MVTTGPIITTTGSSIRPSRARTGGYLILTASSNMITAIVFGVMGVLSLLGSAVFGAACLAERLMCPWYLPPTGEARRGPGPARGAAGGRRERPPSRGDSAWAERAPGPAR